MTNTINVPRELLDNIVLCYNEGEFELGTLAAECHALLSAPSPAGVDGWEVAGDILEKLSDARAIIDGLRGENERIRLNIAEYNEAISCYQSERDQQAQRIGELEGLLREVHDTYRAAIHWEDLRGTMKRIDAALSAGKEGSDG